MLPAQHQGRSGTWPQLRGEGNQPRGDDSRPVMELCPAAAAVLAHTESWRASSHENSAALSPGWQSGHL